jgi:dTDP-4-dehydrorhamnose 3,5-epimerase
METFRADKLEEFLGYKVDFCQDNESRSSYGVLRGLHYQLSPFAQTKLIRVMEGVVWDVVVDIRKGSPTFGKKMCIELSGENKKQLLIPRGFAHGFVVLSEFSRFSYKVDNYYNPKNDRGIAYNDKTLNIDWKVPQQKLILSQKDTKQPAFKDAEYFEYKTNLYG